MDDHMFDRVMDYGRCGLIPRFQEEYAEHGIMQKCPSYEEIVDFCKVLTLICKWDHTRKSYQYKPSDFIY